MPLSVGKYLVESTFSPPFINISTLDVSAKIRKKFIFETSTFLVLLPFPPFI